MFHWKTITILSLLYLCSLLLLHGGTELNPGPRNSRNHLPSFCHWNLNSLPAHNFTEMLFLTLQVPTPQNGQTHPNNSLEIADKLFECV